MGRQPPPVAQRLSGSNAYDGLTSGKLQSRNEDMRTLFLLLCTVLLAGCDISGLFPASDDPAVVIHPGFQINIAGRSIPVQGFDGCATEHNVPEPATRNDGHDCIVLSRDRSVVPVRVFLPSGAATEDWKIIRGAGTTGSVSLQRPDGTLVVAAGQYTGRVLNRDGPS